MSPANAHNRLLRFAAFEVDLRAGELRKHGLRIKLQDQPFQVLAMLLENPGEVVTREELRERLWPADTFVDFDHSLNTAINKLREALSDSAESPRYIETLPRRGYRFVAPVESLPRPAAAPQAAAEKPAEPPGDASGPPARRWRVVPVTDEPAARPPEPKPALPSPFAQPAAQEPTRGTPQWQRWLIFAVGGVFLAVGLTRIPWVRQKLGLDRGAVRIDALAVIPLENLSGDPEQEYFADGMTDAIITNLAGIQALRVISRVSTMQYKKTRKPLPAIARELNVQGIVEGTVLRAGNRVRITVQLLHGPSDRHLWAREYEGELTDVVALQRQVARSIAEEIRIRLTPQERERLTRGREPHPEAYDAFRRGLFHFDKRTEDGIRLAHEYFQRAIRKDPEYAMAYVGLADYYNSLAFYSVRPPGEAFPLAKQMAEKALQLDPTLAEAHAALGMIHGEYEWNWAAAEAAFQRALQLNANYAPAHHWYGEQLVCLGRTEEAQAEAQKAAAIEPVSLVTNSQVALYFYYTRQYDRVVEQAHRMLELDPDFSLGHIWMGMAYQQKGMMPEAIAAFRKATELPQSTLLAHALLGHAYGRAGRRAEALTVLRRLEQLSGQRYVSPAYVTLVYAGLGDREKFFEWLEKSYRERSPLIVRLKVEPMLDPYRAEPRFEQMLRRLAFPAAPPAARPAKAA